MYEEFIDRHKIIKGINQICLPITLTKLKRQLLAEVNTQGLSMHMTKRLTNVIN